MQSVLQMNQLKLEIETKECQISPEVRTRIQPLLEGISSAVEEFPEPQLWITVVFHPNSRRYHAQAKLRLPGKTVITGAYDERLEGAFARCAKRIIHRIGAYKTNPDAEAVSRSQRQAMLRNDVIAPTDPDAGQIGDAIQNDDYAAFRRALLSHEEWVRKRVGRWVQRYPEVQEQIGSNVEIADLVEEVFLLAFETYTERSKDVAIQDWLDGLIDPAVKTFWRQPAEEREAIASVQSAIEAERAKR